MAIRRALNVSSVDAGDRAETVHVRVWSASALPDATEVTAHVDSTAREVFDRTTGACGRSDVLGYGPLEAVRDTTATCCTSGRDRAAPSVTRALHR